MQILLNKEHHKMMITSRTDEVSMISWVPGVPVRDKVITGVRTELFVGKKEARSFLRKFVRLMEDNGYKINFENK